MAALNYVDQVHSSQPSKSKTFFLRSDFLQHISGWRLNDIYAADSSSRALAL